MKQKFILGLMLLSVLLLSSCQKDTWRQGTLDYKFTPTTSRNGYFEERQVAYPEDISITGYANQINDFSFLGSVVEVTGDLQIGDVIRGLVLDIDGVGQFSFPNIPVYKNGEVITIADSRNNVAFYNFMMNAFNYMRNTGKQDIIVSAYLEDRYGYAVPGARVEVNIYNDLDVNVND
jgi:hypothetical protein